MDGRQPRAGERGRHEAATAHAGRNEGIVVFRIRSQDSACAECGRQLAGGDFLRKEGDKGLCLDCADLGRLEFLTAGDAALTRRAVRYSTLHAVVVKWSRARKRYERQGVLAEPEAIDRAEAECLADEEVRRRRREREAGRREEQDKAYVAEFARRMRAQYPGCPEEEARRIAGHACRKHSGRVGRSAAAKGFDSGAIELAVRAAVRHSHTPYDRLLAAGRDRHEARVEVGEKVDAVLRLWAAG
ncbi:MAG: DUF2293 domain-containing protein [Deltaproteobacteria bacterium]|nr:DUF2293 domain-containing protein [Deltaproteobacteria bacterium]